MARRGRSRLTWAGFALFGWVYLGTTFGPWADVNGVKAPPYVTRWVLDYAVAVARHWEPYHIDTGAPGEALFSPFPTWGIGGGMNVGRVTGRAGAARFVPPRDAFQFRRIGHCLAAIMFGLAGAVCGRFIANDDDRPNH
jgi:hypothetical protein